MRSTVKIFNYGSINIDHIYQVPHLVAPGETLSSTAYQQVLGGKGANQSIAIARAGADVMHIGRANVNDAWAIEQMAQAGVNCDLVSFVEQPSGHAIIQVDAQAENSIVLFGGANQSFTQQDIEHSLSTAAQGDWLLLQNECSNTANAVEVAAKKGMKVVFNPSPMLTDIDTFPLDKIDLLIVNEIELSQLLSDSSKNTTVNSDANVQAELIGQVQKRYPNMQVVITLGDKGAIWVSDGHQVSADALKVSVVDTTAAGDTFLGYLLAANGRGDSKQAALKIACKASSIAVQSLGASSSIPSAEQVSNL
jgi:ribokinase